MVNLKNKYVVKVFVPTEIICSTMMGIEDTLLCEKEGNYYIDLVSKKRIDNDFIISVIPLKKYNKHSDKEEVHKLVKKSNNLLFFIK